MSTEHNIIKLNDIKVNVIRKDIKNVHLSVHPPNGRVTISAPLRADLETIRLFLISKLVWIRKHQKKLKNQKREAARDYVTRESHFFLGKRYLLKTIVHHSAPQIILKHNRIELYLRDEVATKQKEEVLQSWYRQELKKIAEAYMEKLEKKMKVKPMEIRVRTMKTKWGTCNIKAKRIWLNTELAKKPIEYIEYVLVHEMTHLLERNHNDKFVSYMNKFSPNWKHIREELNRLPLGHVEWGK